MNEKQASSAIVNRLIVNRLEKQSETENQFYSTELLPLVTYILETFSIRDIPDHLRELRVNIEQVGIAGLENEADPESAAQTLKDLYFSLIDEVIAFIRSADKFVTMTTEEQHGLFSSVESMFSKLSGPVIEGDRQEFMRVIHGIYDRMKSGEV